MLSWLNSRVFEGSVSFSERREDTLIVAYVISKDDTCKEIIACKNHSGLISVAGSSF